MKVWMVVSMVPVEPADGTYCINEIVSVYDNEEETQKVAKMLADGGNGTYSVFEHAVHSTMWDR